MTKRYHAIGLNTLRMVIEQIWEDFRDEDEFPLITVVNSDDAYGEYSTYTVIAISRRRSC